MRDKRSLETPFFPEDLTPYMDAGSKLDEATDLLNKDVEAALKSSSRGRELYDTLYGRLVNIQDRIEALIIAVNEDPLISSSDAVRMIAERYVALNRERAETFAKLAHSKDITVHETADTLITRLELYKGLDEETNEAILNDLAMEFDMDVGCLFGECGPSISHRIVNGAIEAVGHHKTDIAKAAVGFSLGVLVTTLVRRVKG